MRPWLPALALACALVPAAPAAAERRGTPQPGEPARTVTTRELNARALTHNPLVRHQKAEREAYAERRPRRVRRLDASIDRDLVTVKRERPSGVQKQPNPRAPARADGSSAQRRAPGPRTLTVTQGFDGPSLADGVTPTFPPDTQGDIGPTQYVAMLNNRFRSYSRATGLPDGALDTTPAAFWQSVMTPLTGGVTSNFVSDPRIRYDRLTDRWIAVMIDVPNGGSRPNRVMIAVSDGGTITPSTVWSFFFVEGVAGRFADYPTLGVDANALYIGTDDFPTGSGSVNTSAIVVRKSSLLDGGPIVSTRFANLVGASPGPGIWTPQGVDKADPAATTGHFIGVDFYVFGKLIVHRVSDPGGTPVLSAPMALTVPATSFPLKVPHKDNANGTTGHLDAIDDRLYAATMRDGRIWTAHNIGFNASGGVTSATRTGTRWYEVDVSGATPAVVQSGSVFDAAATSPRFYFMPTIATNGLGTAAIGGSVAGAAAFADAWFSARSADDAPGAMQAPATYTASTFPYNPSNDPGNASYGRRWGDYSLMRVDPIDDLTMWTIQEYTTALNTWGTRVVRLQAAPPPVPAAAASTIVTRGASTDVTLTAAGGDGGYFDPGPGFSRPTATLTGCTGVTVQGLSVTDPRTFVLSLAAAADAAGTCGVTFTNPDGQSAAGPGLLALNSAPAAAADGYAVTMGDTLTAPSVLANDTDADGDPLTAVLESGPGSGALDLAPDGTFRFTAAAPGTVTFSYRADDGRARSAPATVTIGVAQPAVATPTPTATPIPTAAARRCRVPRVRGLTLKRAKRKLKAAGCRAGKVRRVRKGKGKVKRRRVLSTKPRAGKRRPAGTKVTIRLRR